jgi:hypothetical protein
MGSSLSLLRHRQEMPACEARNGKMGAQFGAHLRIKEGQVEDASSCAKDPNSGSRLCQVDQTLVDRLFDRSGASGNVKLLKQTLDVGFHRPFSNPKFVPDGLIAVAFSNEP